MLVLYPQEHAPWAQLTITVLLLPPRAFLSSFVKTESRKGTKTHISNIVIELLTTSVYKYVCMHYAHMHTCSHKHSCTITPTHAHPRTRTCAYPRTPTHSHSHAPMHNLYIILVLYTIYACMHACINTNIDTCIQTNILCTRFGKSGHVHTTVSI